MKFLEITCWNGSTCVRLCKGCLKSSLKIAMVTRSIVIRNWKTMVLMSTLDPNERQAVLFILMLGLVKRNLTIPLMISLVIIFYQIPKNVSHESIIFYPNSPNCPNSRDVFSAILPTCKVMKRNIRNKIKRIFVLTKNGAITFVKKGKYLRERYKDFQFSMTKGRSKLKQWN